MNSRDKRPDRPASPADNSGSDALIRLMQRHGIPVTRESYLELAYMGDVPAELSAEEEAELPPDLQKGATEPKEDDEEELSEEEAWKKHRERQRILSITPHSETVESLINFCRADNRVCPLPQHWARLHELLVRHAEAGNFDKPPPPLILAAWYEPAKM